MRAHDNPRGGAPPGDLLQGHGVGQRVQPGPAQLLGDVDPHEAELAHLPDLLGGELAALVDLAGDRPQLGLGELPAGVLEHLVGLRQLGEGRRAQAGHGPLVLEVILEGWGRPWGEAEALPGRGSDEGHGGRGVSGSKLQGRDRRSSVFSFLRRSCILIFTKLFVFVRTLQGCQTSF